MAITDQDIGTFKSSGNGRTSNDRDNKSRELVVTTIINSTKSDIDSLRKQISDPVLLSSIIDSLTSALTSLATDLELRMSPSLFSARLRGGRGNNHDFDLIFQDQKTQQILAVELKKGTSIYDQPQFLSIYVNSTEVTSDQIRTYAEYFYDNYFEKLRNHARCSPIGREEYLRGVFGTTYNSIPFSELYALVKTDDSARSKLGKLHHDSVDSYLREILENSSTGLNWTALQNRLFQQLPKYFLSWQATSRNFIWERFSKESLTLTGAVSTKSKSDGRVTSIVLPTRTGQQIEMLLRWKNNPCVKGPAWQIKLTAPNH